MANGKGKYIVIGAVSLLSILFLLWWFFAPAWVITGFTIKSVSHPNVALSPDSPQQTPWIITGVAGVGGVSQIQALFSQADFKAKSGVMPENVVLFNIQSVDEEAIYRVRQEPDFLHHYYIYEFQNKAGGADFLGILGKLGTTYDFLTGHVVGTMDACPNTPQKYTIPSTDQQVDMASLRLYFKATGIFDISKEIQQILCTYKIKNGYKGIITSPTVRFKAIIDISAGGETKPVTITSESQSADFGSNYGYVTWSGSLATGYYPPEEANYRAIYTYGDSKYHVVLEDRMREYESQATKVDAAIFERKGETIEFWTMDDFDTFVQNKIKTLELTNKLHKEMTSEAKDVMVIDAELDKDQSKTIPTEFVMQKKDNNWELKGVLEGRVLNPVLTFNLNAEWIGIIKPEGIPDIISPTCNVSFSSGEGSGTITLMVKNVGEYTGSFIPSMSDCEIYRQTTAVVNPLVLDIGKTGSLTIPVTTGLLNMDYEAKCPVVVKEANNPARYDTIECVVTLKKGKQCTPDYETPVYIGRELCIQKCSSDGASITTKECCKSTESIGADVNETGGLRCISFEESTDGSGGSTKYVCEDGREVTAKADCEKIVRFEIPWGILIIVIVVIIILLIVGIVGIVLYKRGEK